MKTNQQGATVFGAAIYVAMGLLIALTGLKLIPVYMENYTVNKLLHSLNNDKANRTAIFQAPNKTFVIKRILDKTFDVNQVRAVPLKNLKVTMTTDGYHIALDYKKQIHFIGNIDLLLTFDNRVDVKRGK